MWKKRFYMALILVMFLNVEMAGASTGPSPRMGHRMIYDPVNKRAILFGGSLWDQGASRYTFYNDLWSYDVEDGTWTEIETGLKPPGRFNHMMIYISETHQIVLFGGFTSQDRIGDTWIYDIDGNTWTRVDTDEAPSPRSDAAFCYDPRYGVAILFDGYGLNDDHPNDTCVFNVTSHHWTRKSPEASPKPQYGHYMVFDTVNQKAIMYGGHWSYGGGTHGYSDGVWTYDYQTDTWTKVDDATALPSRYWHSLAYDSDRGKMVVFGGSGGETDSHDDTWLYDYSTNTWERINVPLHPSGRKNSHMVYDPVTGRIILFGGLREGGEDPLNDLWILDTTQSTWTQVETAKEAPPSQETGLAIPGFALAAMIIGTLATVFLQGRRR